MIRIGVIGYGYWGPNIVRNFDAAPGTSVSVVCDADPTALAKACAAHSGIRTCTDYRELINADDVDAVAVVTPVSLHYEIARSALMAGKHVFVEKPFVSESDQGEELIALADSKGLTIMVDHTFLFTGAVRKIKELIADGVLGKLLYFDSTRVNLGLFQHDTNVVWDLAPHDFSIMDHVLGVRPVAVAAHGIDHFDRGLENIAYITVYCEDNLIAHFTVNWLSPVKIRQTLIGGDSRMLVWDDLSPDEKIKVYDKGVTLESQETIHKLLVEYRAGDINIPKVDRTEALKNEANYFAECIENGTRPFNDGAAGLRVVKLLEATSKSLTNRGKEIEL